MAMVVVSSDVTSDNIGTLGVLSVLVLSLSICPSIVGFMSIGACLIGGAIHPPIHIPALLSTFWLLFFVHVVWATATLAPLLEVGCHFVPFFSQGINTILYLPQGGHAMIPLEVCALLNVFSVPH
jgi:hypothetical protein